jgi:transcriptional regulator with XRE-family HTH domain
MGKGSLLFLRSRRKARNPKTKAYPVLLRTVGDHIRKKRLDQNLFQKDVASIIGVEESTVHNWEKDVSGIAIRVRPKIIQFLGYNPFPIHDESLGERIKIYRKSNGLSQKNFARELGIDPTTLARWERNESEPAGKLRARLGGQLVSILTLPFSTDGRIVE